MDPFPEVAADAEQQIAALKRVAQGPVLSDTQSDYTNAVLELRETLADLHEAIELAERAPSDYGLSAHDIALRRERVRQLEQLFQQTDQEFARRPPSRGHVQQQPVASSSNRILHDGGNPFARYEDNEVYNEFQQQETIRQQDQDLDQVLHLMKNIHLQAQIMGQELDEQGAILEDMEMGMDRVGGKLSRGARQMDRFLAANRERATDCCIVLLVVVLIILLVLVVLV